MREKRLGRFSVSDEMLIDHTEEFAAVMVTMGAATLRIECEWDKCRYTAWSPMFDVVGVGEVVPEYDLTVTTDDGEIQVDVKRRHNTPCPEGSLYIFHETDGGAK